jgi:hypothetical protein
LHVIEVDKARSQIEGNIKVPDYLFALGIGIPANGKEKQLIIWSTQLSCATIMISLKMRETTNEINT